MGVRQLATGLSGLGLLSPSTHTNAPGSEKAEAHRASASCSQFQHATMRGDGLRAEASPLRQQRGGSQPRSLNQRAASAGDPARGISPAVNMSSGRTLLQASNHSSSPAHHHAAAVPQQQQEQQQSHPSSSNQRPSAFDSIEQADPQSATPSGQGSARGRLATLDEATRRQGYVHRQVFEGRPLVPQPPWSYHSAPLQPLDGYSAPQPLPPRGTLVFNGNFEGVCVCGVSACVCLCVYMRVRVCMGKCTRVCVHACGWVGVLL